MNRHAFLVTCLAAGLVGSPSGAQEKVGLAEALAIQETLQKITAEAEPAIACILVSRSEAYHQLGQGAAPPPASAIYGLSRLGGFQPGTKSDLKKLDLADPSHVPESFGSGVVIDAKGLILTNYHVVQDATKIYVRLPGNIGSYADIHAADRRSDLAVLRLIDDKLALKAIKIGDGSKLRKGQLVLTIANPFAPGFRDSSPTASWGMVGNVRKKFPELLKPDLNLDLKKISLHAFGTLAFADNRLNLGCSGGAMIDLRGEMVGLTTTVLPVADPNAGASAVALDAALKRIVDRLREGQEVEYGLLGVTAGDDPQPREGVRLGTVGSGSPAFQAGLRSQDILLSINGTKVEDTCDLFLQVGTYLAGTEVRLEYKSANQVRTGTATLAKFHYPGKILAANQPPAIRGLRVDYTSVLTGALSPWRTPLGIPDGVAVREVQENSPAESALVKVHDVITHVNGRRVSTPADFYREADKAKGPLELTVLDPIRQVKIN